MTRAIWLVLEVAYSRSGGSLDDERPNERSSDSGFDYSERTIAWVEKAERIVEEEEEEV